VLAQPHSSHNFLKFCRKQDGCRLTHSLSLSVSCIMFRSMSQNKMPYTNVLLYQNVSLMFLPPVAFHLRISGYIQNRPNFFLYYFLLFFAFLVCATVPKGGCSREGRYASYRWRSLVTSQLGFLLFFHPIFVTSCSKA
jgi:hypothetical protein